MAVSNCIRSFILAILCGNPILRGAWVTVLNTLIVRLSQEVDLLTTQITRLNIHNQILSLAINSFEALESQVSSNLNLFLGPLKQFHGCVDLQKISNIIQADAVGKRAAAIKKQVYEFNRNTNLVNIQNTIKQEKEQAIVDIQEFINAINDLCD